MSSSFRVGLFGGTFNPVHNAHIKVAEEAMDQIGLDKVILIPSKNPPHKPTRGLLDAEVRHEMVRLAVEDEDHFEVSRVEIERGGPSYTVDTIETMKEKFARVAFIVGADNLIKIDTWKQPEKLLSGCPFIIAPRGGYKKEDFVGDIFEGKDLRFLDMDEISISSTDIRERVAKGKSIKNMVPRPVLNYILQEGLYQKVPEGV